MGDMFMLLLMGLIGWAMKHADWPRAPALVGFVLADPMEQYFWLSNQIHGWSWLMRPGVLIIIGLMLAPFIYRLWKSRFEKGEKVQDVEREKGLGSPVNLALSLTVLSLFTWAFFESLTYSPDSRLLPWLGLIPGIPVTCFLLIRGYLCRERDKDLMPQSIKELPYLLSLGLYVFAIFIVGFSIATPPFVAWMLFSCAKMRIHTGLLYGTVICTLSFLLFSILRNGAPDGIFGPLI
jgi:putative tricarboxylic transport membrane protein